MPAWRAAEGLFLSGVARRGLRGAKRASAVCVGRWCLSGGGLAFTIPGVKRAGPVQRVFRGLASGLFRDQALAGCAVNVWSGRNEDVSSRPVIRSAEEAMQ